MKLLTAALICLALLIGFCAVGTIASLNSIGEILDLLESVDDDGAHISPAAEDAANKIKNTWEKNEFVISLVHPHGHLDEVEEKITDLCSYATSDDYAAWHNACESLKAALGHLHDLLTANIDNVM